MKNFKSDKTDNTNDNNIDEPQNRFTHNESSQVPSSSHNNFSVAQDLKILLDNSKFSSEANSSFNVSGSNSVGSILYEKTGGSNQQARNDRSGIFSNKFANFDNESSAPEVHTNTPLQSSLGETLNFELSDLSNMNDLRNTQELNIQRPMDINHSEALPNLRNSYGQAINNLPFRQDFVSTSNFNSDLRNFEDGEDVLHFLENSYTDEMNDIDFMKEFPDLEQEDFEKFIDLKYHCLPEDVVLDADIAEYISGPDYLEDLHALPGLFEFLKTQPKKSEISPDRLNALRRLKLLKAQLEKAHVG